MRYACSARGFPEPVSGVRSSRTPESFKARLLVACSLACVALAGTDARAQVSIKPVVVEVAATQRPVAVTVTLSTKARAPLRLQAELLSWKQDRQGRDVTSSSDDLLVSPAIAELSPGEQQVFRVALRHPRPSNEERAYRLILEDVADSPGEGPDPASLGINFRMRYDLPVLLAPAGPVANVLRWHPCPEDVAASTETSARPSVGGAQACVRVLNAGNRRVKVQQLTLVGEGWEQPWPLKEGETVLAGTEREWRVPLASGHAGTLLGLRAQTARGETLQAQAGAF